MIKTIHPYWNGYSWEFDDAEMELEGEPFVSGSSEVVTALVERKGISAHNVALTFSDETLDACDAVATWIEADEYGLGNWYEIGVDGKQMIGWLCPALLKYFESAPARLFVRVDNRV